MFRIIKQHQPFFFLFKIKTRFRTYKEWLGVIIILFLFDFCAGRVSQTAIRDVWWRIEMRWWFKLYSE